MISRNTVLLLAAALLLAGSLTGCCCPRGPEIASLDGEELRDAG